MPPKRKASSAGVEQEEAVATPTSDQKGKGGRAKKPAATAAAGTEGPPPAAKDDAKETPPKAAKRGRPRKDEAAAGPVEDAKGKQEPPAKKAKAAAKSAPLQRSPTPRALAHPEDCRVLKMLSVNVAGLRAVLNSDKAQTLKALVERELPDVLCLNEHKLKESDVAEAEAKLKELLPKEYSTMHWACSTVKKGYSGVAVLLRQPAEGEASSKSSSSSSAAIPDPASVPVARGMGKVGEGDSIIEEEGRILTLDLPELSLISTYVPNSGLDLKRLDYRVNREAAQCWDRALAAYVKQLREEKGKPVVVLGDLNCGYRVQDIWNMYERPDFPQGLAEKPVTEQYVGLSALKKFAGLTPQERESFPKLLQDAELVDTFRALHPDSTGVFSYFSQKVVQNRPMNRGLRLDYVLASSSMCAHLAPAGTSGSGDASAGSASGEAAEPRPLPRVHDSFILDEGDLVADHAAVGCLILLPAAVAAAP